MPDPTARLLIVDDDPVITTTLSVIFSQLGHQVRTASEGISALQKIRTQVPDILVSDLNMPRMSGFELLSVVRRRFPEVFVIASSAAFSGEEVPAGIAADAFHEKSAGLTRLFELVKTAAHKGHVRSGWNASTPIWISRTQDETSCFERLPITCPECLRGFSLSVGASDFVLKEANCVCCDARVYYGVVARMKPAAPSQSDGRRRLSCSSFLIESCGRG